MTCVSQSITDTTEPGNTLTTNNAYCGHTELLHSEQGHRVIRHLPCCPGLVCTTQQHITLTSACGSSQVVMPLLLYCSVRTFHSNSFTCKLAQRGSECCLDALQDSCWRSSAGVSRQQSATSHPPCYAGPWQLQSQAWCLPVPVGSSQVVMPLLLNAAILLSLSMPPTPMTSGWSAGLLSVPYSGPSLPMALIMIRPLLVTSSTYIDAYTHTCWLSSPQGDI